MSQYSNILSSRTLLFTMLIFSIFFACSKNEEPAEIVIVEPQLPIPANTPASMAVLFDTFADVSTDFDSEFFYINSLGVPEHGMMKGITYWNQHVPLYHGYIDSNSWSIPIQPELATNPVDLSKNGYKGAIAVAINGIPIYSAMNEFEQNSSMSGELDKWGGHCGPDDDYHYHLPPTHLQTYVGNGKPIAYALDGFPVYGETNDELDEFFGKYNADGSYQYHTVHYYPYFIPKLKGKVKLNSNANPPDNKLVPHAIAEGVRPEYPWIDSMEITDFRRLADTAFSLTYLEKNELYQLFYTWNNDSIVYIYTPPGGPDSVEVYYK